MPSAQSSEDSLKSDAFSAGTKLEVRRLTGEDCWACGNEWTHICHVVAKEDPQARLWDESGLINFSSTSARNAIPLCPTCHNQFDLAADPGFLFIPTDLQYFIQIRTQG
ncbi:hypothetical protein VTN77DRAFT_7309 [Rasamsonia byssochlamydoides]|uniref:uncharacterized protein n=1 Tax=Rasamsonia byssochlamydoides TaxID=89139 RepID=UPI003743FF74